MADTDRTPEELYTEIETLRARVAELEQAEAKRKRAEEALRESQSNLQTLFNALEDFLFILDTKGRIVHINPVVRERLGYSTEELVGKDILEVHPPDQREESAAIFSAMLAGKTNASSIPLWTKDGLLIPVDTKVTRGTWSGQDALFGISRDVTALTETVQALRKSETLFRTLVENSPVGIFMIDDAYHFVYVNDELGHIFGISPEAFIGQDFRKVLDDETRKMVVDRYARRRKGEEVPARYEIKIVGADGLREQYAELMTAVWEDREGNIRTIGQLLDMTERKQAEEKLRESEERYRTLFESSPEAIFLIGPDGKLVDCNNATEALVGRSRENLVGKLFTELGTLPEDDLPQYMAMLERILSGEKIQPLEVQVIAEGGGLRLLEVHPIVLRKDDKVWAIQVLGRDITERKRAEEEIRRRNRELAALNEISAVVSQSLNLDEILNAGLDKALALMQLGVGGIYIADHEHQRLNLAVHRGVSEEYAEEMGSISVDKKTVEAVTAQGKLRRFILSAETIIRNPAKLRQIKSAMQREGLRLDSTVPVLLQAREEILGVMIVASRGPRQYSEVELRLLTSVGQQISVAIQNAQLYKEAWSRSRYLETLQQINATLRSTLPLSQVLDTIAQGAGEALGYVGSLIVLPDANGERLVRGAVWGKRFLDAAVKFTGRQVAAFNLSLTVGENPMVQAYLTGELQVWSHKPDRIVIGVEPSITPRLALAIARTMGATMAACVPLPAGEEVVGVLVVFSPRAQLSAGERAMLLGLADQAGLAIQNARLYQELETHSELLERVVKERTAELQAANERLQALSLLKDEFVSNVSHELRTPITTIKVHHRLLEMEPDRLDKSLPVLQRETERLRSIIEDLLRLSRLDQDRVELQLALVDLNDLARQYVADRQPLAEGKGLALTFNGQENLPSVQADEGLLGQVLSILLTNALNYTLSGGSVAISTQSREEDEQIWVGLSINDTGPGILPREQPQVFERFFRGQVGRESGEPGTGLGLAIAREIVERHRGRIEVASEGKPGKGTTFTVWLPTVGGMRG